MASPSIYTIVSDLKIFLLGGYQTFPLTMAGTLLILGFMTANYAMLFFLLGLVIIAPILTFGINWVSAFAPDHLWFFPRLSNVCDIVTPAIDATSTEHGPFMSYWITMTMFFFGYMLSNAYTMYSLPPTYPSNDPDIKAQIDQQVSMRQSQTVIGLTMILLLALVFIGMRFQSGCDTILGLFLATGAFGALGFYWYKALSTSNKNTLSDMYGIANRLMSPESLKNEPIGCIPQA